MSKRERKTYRHPKTGHQAATALPVEQNRLRGQGYREVTPKPNVTPKSDK